MGPRRQSRESALQALYMCDVLGRWTPENVDFCFNYFEMDKDILEYARKLAVGVIENITTIDAKLRGASKHWSVTRMNRVDRTILRIASFELLYLEDIPAGVAINEAIEIAKRFGADESPVFVNGVLDTVASEDSNKIKIVKEITVENSAEVPEVVVEGNALRVASSDK